MGEAVIGRCTKGIWVDPEDGYVNHGDRHAAARGLYDEHTFDVEESYALFEPPDWHAHAACKGDTASLFSDVPAVTRRVRERCYSCPVQHECRMAGMDEEFGIWGGLTAKDRENLRSRRFGGTTPPGRPASLTPSDVEEIRAAYAKGGTSHRLLAQHYGVSEATIRRVVNRTARYDDAA